MSHQVQLGRSPSNDEGVIRTSHAVEVSGPDAIRKPAPTEATSPPEEQQIRNAEPAPQPQPQPTMPQHGRA